MRVLNEGDDAHLSCARGALKRVNLVVSLCKRPLTLTQLTPMVALWLFGGGGCVRPGAGMSSDRTQPTYGHGCSCPQSGLAQPCYLAEFFQGFRAYVRLKFGLEAWAD